MEYTILGRAGLSVSIMGLGCGGHSRLGIRTGKTEAEAVEVVRKALSLGINFIDTAEAYGTESIVSEGLRSTKRESVVISTKVSPRQEDRLATAAEIRARAEGCLRRLNTDYLDILHLHGVSAEDYSYAVSELVPALLQLQQEGKVRFLGITEAFGHDPSHQMLALALKDDCWDVIMAGFNILNQSARELVFEQTQARNIGILCMFAARRALSRHEALLELMSELVQQGKIDAEEFDKDDPLGFLMANDSASSLPDAAYRFCRYEPGIHVVLSGTGNILHLEANAASLNSPPLPQRYIEKLKRIFRRVDNVSGN